MQRQLVQSIKSSLRLARNNHVVSPMTSATTHDHSELRPLAAIPGPSGLAALPFIGPSFLFSPYTEHTLDKAHLMFRELHEKYGKLIKYRRGLEWQVVTFDPSHVQLALQHEGRYPHRPSVPIMATHNRRTGKQPGLSGLQGADWHRIRQPVQEKIARPCVLGHYLPPMTSVADDLLTHLERSGVTSGLENSLFRYSTESAGVICLNRRLGFLDAELSESQKDFLKDSHLFMELVATSVYTFPAFRLFPTRLYRQYARIAEGLCSLSREHVAQALSDIEEKKSSGTFDPEEPNLLLSLLGDHRISSDQITSLLTGFLSVTMETVAKSLTVLLWHLARHPDKQETLYQELQALVPPSLPLSPPVLGHLPYLKACLKESHRLVMPSPLGHNRVLESDMVLDNYLIPAGTTIHFGSNIMGRNPDYFDKPEAFLPERWLHKPGSDAKTTAMAYSVLPFGLGPRNCVGRRFAELQIYLAVIKILQRFKLSLQNPDEELEIVYRVIGCPKDPVKINFEMRR